MSNFARRAEMSCVVTVAPYAPPTPDYPIHRARESNRKSSRAAGERIPVARFDEQVNMIALHGELDEAKSRAGTRGESATDFEKDGLPAKAWKTRNRT
jgi:hypothetical protein